MRKADRTQNRADIDDASVLSAQHARQHGACQQQWRGNVGVDEIVWSHINEETVGNIVIYYELLTSVSGALLEVNTYDQPGVELGKQILASYFKH